MTDYFEDMWLALEQELNQFDNYKSEFRDLPTTNPDQSSIDTQQQPQNIEHSTYESLLEVQRAPNPSHDRIRSTDIKERIDAIRELYNKTPMIISIGSMRRIEKIANNLYKKGFVKEGNAVRDILGNSTKDIEADIMDDAIYSFLCLNSTRSVRKIAAAAKDLNDERINRIFEIWDNFIQLKSFEDDLPSYNEQLRYAIDNQQYVIDTIGRMQEFYYEIVPKLIDRLELFEDIRANLEDILKDNQIKHLDLILKELSARVNPIVRNKDRDPYYPSLIKVREKIKQYLHQASDSELANFMLSNDEFVRATTEEEYTTRQKQRQPDQKKSKQLYNLYKIAQKLYRSGMVKEGNELEHHIESEISKHFSYSTETSDKYKTLTVDQNNGEQEILVNIVDKNKKDTITEQFSSISEAMEFFEKE